MTYVSNIFSSSLNSNRLSACRFRSEAEKETGNLPMFASHPVGELKVQRRGLLWLRAAILHHRSLRIGQEFCRTISNALNPDIMRRAVTL